MTETYGERVAEALEAEARGADVLVNEVVSVDLADTAPNETVSMHVALLKNDGNRFGCVFCRFLDIALQKGHCEAVLTNQPLPWWVYPKAAALFAVALVPPILAAYEALRLLF